jgi:hypothetical protein
VALHVSVPVNFRISSILRISFLRPCTKTISSSLSSVLSNSRITKATVAVVISMVKVVEDFKLVEVSNRAMLTAPKIRIPINSREPKKLYQLPVHSYKSLTETDLYRGIKVVLDPVVWEIVSTFRTNSVFISVPSLAKRNSRNLRVVTRSMGNLSNRLRISAKKTTKTTMRTITVKRLSRMNLSETLLP